MTTRRRALRGMPRTQLLRALENLRRQHCCYMSEGRKRYGCDCKFGADKTVRVGHEVGCGCPELASARELLAALTPTEWRRVLKRTGLAHLYE